MPLKYYPIPSAVFFRATGPHATRYLHNRLSNNIRDLKIGDHLRAAALNPQGRAEAFVTVVREEAEKYLIYSDGGDSAAIRAALLRYKVADRIDLSDLPLKLWHVVGGFDTPAFAPKNVITIPAGRSPFGMDLVSDVFLPPDGATMLSQEEATEIRISSKWPIFPDEINDDVMLLELGLSDAVSFTKGCYVGQEVLERVDSQGRPPRILYICETGSAPSTNTIKDNTGRTIGEALTAVKRKIDGYILFALIKSSVAAKIGDTFDISGAKLRICQ
jgi:folate-binding protein YgfZ